MPTHDRRRRIALVTVVGGLLVGLAIWWLADDQASEPDRRDRPRNGGVAAADDGGPVRPSIAGVSTSRFSDDGLLELEEGARRARMRFVDDGERPAPRARGWLWIDDSRLVPVVNGESDPFVIGPDGASVWLLLCGCDGESQNYDPDEVGEDGWLSEPVPGPSATLTGRVRGADGSVPEPGSLLRIDVIGLAIGSEDAWWDESDVALVVADGRWFVALDTEFERLQCDIALPDDSDVVRCYGPRPLRFSRDGGLREGEHWDLGEIELAPLPLLVRLNFRWPDDQGRPDPGSGPGSRNVSMTILRPNDGTQPPDERGGFDVSLSDPPRRPVEIMGAPGWSVFGLEVEWGRFRFRTDGIPSGSDVDVRLQPTSTIVGRVRSDEKPVPYRVRLLGSSLREEWYTTVDGAFEARRIPPGTYDVVVEGSGGRRTSKRGVIVPDGLSTPKIDIGTLQLPALRSEDRRIRVVNDERSLLPDAWVRVRDADGLQAGRWEGAGTITARFPLNARPLSVEVGADRYLTRRFSGHVPDVVVLQRGRNLVVTYAYQRRELAPHHPYQLHLRVRDPDAAGPGDDAWLDADDGTAGMGDWPVGATLDVTLEARLWPWLGDPVKVSVAAGSVRITPGKEPLVYPVPPSAFTEMKRRLANVR